MGKRREQEEDWKLQRDAKRNLARKESKLSILKNSAALFTGGGSGLGASMSVTGQWVNDAASRRGEPNFSQGATHNFTPHNGYGHPPNYGPHPNYSHHNNYAAPPGYSVHACYSAPPNYYAFPPQVTPQFADATPYAAQPAQNGPSAESNIHQDKQGDDIRSKFTFDEISVQQRSRKPDWILADNSNQQMFSQVTAPELGTPVHRRNENAHPNFASVSAAREQPSAPRKKPPAVGGMGMLAAAAEAANDSGTDDE